MGSSVVALAAARGSAGLSGPRRGGPERAALHCRARSFGHRLRVDGLSDDLADESSDGERRGEAGGFDAGRLDDEWILAIATDQEIRERAAGIVQLRADAA